MLKCCDCYAVAVSDFDICGDWESAILLAVLREQPEAKKGLPIVCTQKELAEVSRFPKWKVHSLLKKLNEKGAVSLSVVGKSRETRSSILVMRNEINPDKKTESGQIMLAEEFISEEERWEREMYVAFEDCWHIYPRKVGKHYAFECFKREVKKGADPKVIFRMLQKAQDNWKGTQVQYIPHLSTWLNQGRYNDYGNYAPIYKGQDKEDEFQGF